MDAQTYTVTNVTLKNGTGYTIQFANPNDLEEVYAQGPKFEVKVAGSEFSRYSFSRRG